MTVPGGAGLPFHLLAQGTDTLEFTFCPEKSSALEIDNQGKVYFIQGEIKPKSLRGISYLPLDDGVSLFSCHQIFWVNLIMLRPAFFSQSSILGVLWHLCPV